jgi:aminopeptidase N
MSSSDVFSLMKVDSDSFNRWDKTQQVLLEEILSISDTLKSRKTLPEVSLEVLEGLFSILRDPSLDSHFKSLALTLPSLDVLQQRDKDIDFKRLSRARRVILEAFATKYSRELLASYMSISPSQDYQFEPGQVGARALRNCLLNYLGCMEIGESLAYGQFHGASNMTELYGSLKVMVGYSMKDSEKYLSQFFDRFKHDDLVIDAWFRLQASSDHEDSLKTLKVLMKHPAYNRLNPNRARSVLGGFSLGNLPWFHEESGEGYQLFARELLLIDQKNPQIAARLARGFGPYKRAASNVKEKAQAVLKNIQGEAGISKDLFEVVQTLLKS